MSGRWAAAGLLAGLAVQAGPLLAQAFPRVDINQDGVIEYEEAARYYPNLKPPLFRKADANRDGVLEPREYPVLENLYDVLYQEK